MKGTELANIERKSEEIIEGEIAQTYNAADLNDLYFQLGGLDAIDAITTNLMSALIRSYQQIRDNQTYRAAGYQRFDEFLDNHPRSRMSYKRFNYIEGIYKNLGPEPFDLLSGSGLSMRQMKQIGKGNVEIDGDKVLVHFDGEVVEEFNINNRREWMQSLKALADSHAEKNIKLARQKEQIEKHGDEKRKLYDDIDRIKAAKIAETASQPHMVARVELGIAFRKLTEAARDLSPIEREQFRDSVLEDVAAWRTALAGSYATEKATKRGPVEVKGDDFAAALDNFLENDLDNDEDLASKL